MAKSAEERLQELLDAKDEEIRRLEDRLAKEDTKIRSLEGNILQLEGGWSVPSNDEEDIEELPVPRLEFRWYQMYARQSENDWSSYIAVYQLVHRHFMGNIIAHPLGVTRVNGGGFGEKLPPWKVFPHRPDMPPSRCDLPNRDGSHVHHDAAHFGLPAYAVTPEGEYIRLDGDPNYEYPRTQGLAHRRDVDV